LIHFERKYKYYQISPVAAAFLVLFVSFFLYQFVGGFFTFLFVGLEITNENAGYVRLFTSISQIIFMLLLSILFAKAIYNDFKGIFRVSKPNSSEVLYSILGLILIVTGSQVYIYIQTILLENFKSANPSLNPIFELLEKIDKLIEKTYIEITTAHNIFDYFSVVLSVALVPAFCEEFLFRGFVQSNFEKRMKPFWAIVLTAFLFSIFHFNPFALLPLFLLGAYFSYLVYLTESIFIPVVLHFLNNFITVTLFYTMKSDELLKTRPSIDIPLSNLVFTLIFIIISFIVVLVILNNQVRNRKKSLNKEIEDENLS